MSDLSHSMPHAADNDASGAPDAPEDLAISVLKIIFFTGFAIVATVLSFVFLPIAGAGIALWLALTGFGAPRRPGGGLALRALSIIAFTGFAVVATVMGFVFLPFVGAVLAALFLWRAMTGFGPLAFGPPARPAPQRGGARRPARPVSPKPGGNEAFDAYRAETLRRLEDERRNFKGFVKRLRASRDQTEFDDFLDARMTSPGTGSPRSGRPDRVEPTEPSVSDTRSEPAAEIAPVPAVIPAASPASMPGIGRQKAATIAEEPDDLNGSGAIMLKP